jgi:hypothetical protein
MSENDAYWFSVVKISHFVRLCENLVGALRRGSGRTVKYVILRSLVRLVVTPSNHGRSFHTVCRSR